VVFPLIALFGNVPLLGWAKPVPVNIRQLHNPRRDYVLVAAAGPASNLVLAIISAFALAALPISPVVLGEANVSAPLASFLSMAVNLNILLAVFNMLPIPPLDGGNVLSGLLPPKSASVLNHVRPYGFMVLYALILTDGFYYLVLRPSMFLRSWLP